MKFRFYASDEWVRNYKNHGLPSEWFRCSNRFFGDAFYHVETGIMISSKSICWNESMTKTTNNRHCSTKITQHAENVGWFRLCRRIKTSHTYAHIRSDTWLRIIMTQNYCMCEIANFFIYETFFILQKRHLRKVPHIGCHICTTSAHCNGKHTGRNRQWKINSRARFKPTYFCFFQNCILKYHTSSQCFIFLSLPSDSWLFSHIPTSTYLHESFVDYFL